MKRNWSQIILFEERRSSWKFHSTVIRQQNQLTRGGLTSASCSPRACWEKQKGIPELEISSLSVGEFDISLTHSIKEDGHWEKGHRRQQGQEMALFSCLTFFHLGLYWCLCLFPPYLMGWLHLQFLFMLPLWTAHLYRKESLSRMKRMRRYRDQSKNL